MMRKDSFIHLCEVSRNIQNVVVPPPALKHAKNIPDHGVNRRPTSTITGLFA